MPRRDAVTGTRRERSSRICLGADWYQVLNVLDDRIVDLTDYGSLDEAEAAAPSH